MNAVNCLGSASAYLIVCGKVFAALFDVTHSQRQIFITFVGLFICLPFALARHINFMRYLAFCSVCALFFLIFAVVYVLSRQGPFDDVTAKSLWDGSGDDNGKYTVALFVNSLNNIVFAYNNQFNVPQISGELSPQGMKRVTWMSFISSGMSFTLYWLVSLFGVLTFGMHQQDTLVDDFKNSPYRRNPIVVCALLAVGFSVLTCFEMHIYPIRQFLPYSIRKIRGLDVDSEAADNQWRGISYTRWLDIFNSCFSVAFAIMIAVKLQSLTKLIDVIGGFASGYISYVCPPMWIMKIRHQRQGMFARPFEAAFCLFMFALGMFFVIFGTYNALLEFK